MSNSLGYPNKKCTFAYRVVRRSKSQNISALALSLNRYHKSVTPSFQSDTQSDISFLIIRINHNQIRFQELHVIILGFRNKLEAFTFGEMNLTNGNIIHERG